MLRSRLGEAVNAIETAIAEAKQMQRGKIGAVSLAVANVSVLSPTLLSILNRFSADHTNYDLRIGLCARPAHEKLLQDEADAVITTGNVFKSLHNLSTMTLFESKPVIICRKQHPVLGCNAGASLSQYPFISLTSPASPSGPDYLQTVCKRLGFSPRIAECAASLDELAVRLLLSDALGVVPDHFAAVHTDTTASIPLPSEMPEQIVIAWKQSNTNPVLHKLIAFLQDTISE